MVVKRQCSFCANEIEPGTGTLFVKRDGTVFSFCSSSCRKQQLHLGRVGHRLKWTRAHALKVESEQRSAPSRSRTTAPAPSAPTPAAAPAAAPTPPASPAKPAEPVAADGRATEAPPSAETRRPARAPKAKAPTTPKPASDEPGATAEKEKPAKTPRARKPKAAAETPEKTSGS